MLSRRDRTPRSFPLELDSHITYSKDYAPHPPPSALQSPSRPPIQLCLGPPNLVTSVDQLPTGRSTSIQQLPLLHFHPLDLSFLLPGNQSSSKHQYCSYYTAIQRRRIIWTCLAARPIERPAPSAQRPQRPPFRAPTSRRNHQLSQQRLVPVDLRSFQPPFRTQQLNCIYCISPSVIPKPWTVPPTLNSLPAAVIPIGYWELLRLHRVSRSRLHDT